jgi:hypothetical protein
MSRPLVAAILAGALAGVASAAEPDPALGDPPPASAPPAAPDPSASPDAPPRAPVVRALLVNGGRSARSNYASHLRHLQELRAVLLARGLPEDAITVLSSDGEDPARDLVVRPTLPRDWLARGRNAQALIGSRSVNSEWPGVPMLPATHASLDTWFTDEGARLVAGDVLFLYTTDHGVAAGAELWGERLAPADLRAKLETLAPGVRVVLTMSQCHSGTFFEAVDRPDTCGFFSAPADRVAYGCYPELNVREGHGFRLVDALGAQTTMADVHAAILRDDLTPDVPLATSDLYALRAVEAQAQQNGVTMDVLIDTLLAGVVPAEVATIAGRFGLPIAEVGTAAATTAFAAALQAASDTHKVLRDSWSRRLGVLADENYTAWEAERDGAWGWRIALPPAEEDARLALSDELLAEVGAYAERTGRLDTLLALEARRDEAQDAWFRLRTQEAAVQRVRAALARAAAARLAERDAALRATLDSAVACEGTALGTPPGNPVPAVSDLPLASLLVAEHLDHRSIGVVLDGTALETVRIGSEAEQAGLLPGDVVLGVEGIPTASPAMVAARLALAPRREGFSLQILREGERLHVSVAAPPVTVEADPAP